MFKYDFYFCNSLSVENGDSGKNKRCNLGEGQSDNNTGSKDRREWWQSCQYDIWRLIQGSHRMAEAVSLVIFVLKLSTLHFLLSKLY